MIFNKKHILINKDFKSKSEFFSFIDKYSFENNISSKSKIVSQGFEKRESEGTTGFEDGFAIPHARIKGINEPSIFILRNKDFFNDWDALDGKGVKLAIALVIPEESGSYHIDVLSTIASKLIDESFRNLIKKGTEKEILDSIKNLLKEIANKAEASNDSKVIANSKEFIIGISKCPAGIAHTFMVKKKMESLANDKNISIKWETQGANGQKNTLTKEDIDKATSIIIASDVELDLSRFKNKKIITTTTNEAIKDTESVYQKSISETILYTGNKNDLMDKNLFKRFKKTMIKSFKSSFGVPWTYLSFAASLLAILALIGFSMYGRDWTTNGLTLNKNLFKIQSIATFALSLAMPFTAMHVVKKATDKSDAAFMVFIGALLLNIPFGFNSINSITGFNTQNLYDQGIFYDWNGAFSAKIMRHGSNIIGSIFVTLLILFIYSILASLKNALSNKKHLKISRIIRMGISPWITTALPAIAMVGTIFLLGSPMAFLSEKIIYGLVVYPMDHWYLRLLIGFVFGTLIAWDLGNTINKITLISLIGLAQYDLRFASLIAVGIPLASIGLGTTHFFNKKRFINKDEEKESSLSFRKGLNGMSEGPLQLKIKHKSKVHISNIISTGLATGLAMVVGIYIIKGGHLGVLFLGAQAHLADKNDIQFLAELLPTNKGIITALCSIVYGIVSYYIIMAIGCFTYLGISSVTFRIGKNKILK